MWRGTNGKGWSYNKTRYEKYVDDDIVKQTIEKYNKNNLVQDFTEIELIKLASFCLNYKKDEYYHVNEKQASELVDEWKAKIS